MDQSWDTDVRPRAESRLWRTEDGGLVLDGDLAGRRLAYAVGDEISDADQSLLEPEPEPDQKASAKPADKSRRAANK